MKISGICFTPGGERTLQRLLDTAEDRTEEWRAYVLSGHRKERTEKTNGIAPWNGRLSAWMEVQTGDTDAFVFVGAAGIAIRAMAPYIQSKVTDPALVVLDEKGQYVIPLLSGHLGGANALAVRIAARLGAQPVLTTATDVNGLFAVDVFAKDNDLWISDMRMAKELSAALLRGETAGLISELPLEGALPAGLSYVEGTSAFSTELSHAEDMADFSIGVVISVRKPRIQYFPLQLWLAPKLVTVGIGCRRDVPASRILDAIEKAFRGEGIPLQAIRGAASIDLKKDEKGLIQAAEQLQVPFMTFDAETLRTAPGGYTESAFVREVTGVDNVCERAAMLGAAMHVIKGEDFPENPRLLMKKQAYDGVTVAAAMRMTVLHF